MPVIAVLNKPEFAMSIRITVLVSYIAIGISVHAGEIRGLEEVRVTADPLVGVDAHLRQPSRVLNRDDLRTRNTHNLGETVSLELGVSASDFAAGAGRPVIRGMQGGRVKILEDGISTMDASTVSTDHAVTTEPIFADQIEILRGPATLLYGSGASGGLVNVVNHRIPTRITRGWEGHALIQYDSVFSGYLAAVDLNTGTDFLALHFDGMQRKTQDYRIPGFAASMPGENEQPGIMENSQVETNNITGGGALFGEHGYIGVSVSEYNSKYGVPGRHHTGNGAEGGVVIDMEQTRYDFKSALDNPIQGLRLIRLRWGYNDYEHIELEPGGGAGTLLSNKELEGRLELLHQPISSWNGMLGLQINQRDLFSSGEEAFIPASQQDSIAVFLLEKGDFGTWHFDGGLRYEVQTSDIFTGLSARHQALSLSGGVTWNYSDNNQLSLSIGHTLRNPAIEELFANGPHLATGTFEIGNASLNEETSVNLDISWRKPVGRFTFTTNFFYNWIADYIFLKESDLNHDGVADRVEEDFNGSPDDIGASTATDELLLVFQSQLDAVFYGFELETVFRLIDDQRGVLDLRLWTDYVKTELNDGGNLPRITPWRLGSGLIFERSPWHSAVDLTYVNNQEDTAILETATEAYLMLNIYAGYTINHGTMDLTVFVRGTNLLDEEARRHTSLVKDLAPLPGRSGLAGVRVSF